MALQNFDSLNDMHLDVLKEICNIGSGNAASSLSQMFGIQIDIEVPEICLAEVNVAVEKFGGAENVMAGLMLPISNSLSGMIMFLYREDFSNMLLKTLMGVEIQSFGELGEMELSALCEVSNIAAASFVNAIASMTGMTIDIAPPSMTVDMVGAIMNVPAVYFANLSDKILQVENRFICGGEHLHSHILMVLDVESLNRLMNSLGIET